MSTNNAFTTNHAARTLGQRHSDIPASVYVVGMVMASFANGKTGTSIRPGLDRLVEMTGFHKSTIQNAISWLLDHDELRQDKAGHRGSAACFTWVGGREVAPPLGDPIEEIAPPLGDPIEEKGSPLGSERFAPRPPHLPNQKVKSTPGSQADQDQAPAPFGHGSPEEKTASMWLDLDGPDEDTPRFCSTHPDVELHVGWCPECAWENDPDNPSKTILRGGRAA